MGWFQAVIPAMFAFGVSDVLAGSMIQPDRELATWRGLVQTSWDSAAVSLNPCDSAISGWNVTAVAR